MNVLPYLPLLLSVPLFALLISSFVTFDRLVALEYRQYHKHWVKDGRPCGFFWIAPEEGLFGSFPGSFARNRLWFSWLFNTPEWALADEQALHFLGRLRRLVLIWTLSIVPVSCLILFLTTRE